VSDPITRFHLTYAERPVGRLALLTMDNGADHTKPTTFGTEALRSLSDALDELEAADDVAGLLLTGKPFIFAVGADLKAFARTDADPVQQARGLVGLGHEVFSRLQALPFPTVAAINGACMGGGLEIALHCDARTLSTGAQVLAFPEVFLSILPGWGGTQLAPRIVGVRNAIETIVINPLNTNRTMSPKEAFERGYADRFYDSASFLDDSVAFLERLVSGEETIDRSGLDVMEGFEEARNNALGMIEGKTAGATPAPMKALELLEFAARGGDLAEGRIREQEALVELALSRHAQASVYSFNLTQQRVKKQPGKPDVPARRITKAAIVGAGLMGAQLGALHLQRLEVPLVMKDIDEGVLERCREHIEGELDKRVAKGRLKPGKADFLKSLVTYTTDYDDVAGADWVMEAVLERMDLKKAIFADLEQVLDEGAVLATNTSSLSVTEMASDLRHPERVVGFHFFNPVAVLPLVEVIRPEQVSDEALSTAFEVAKKLRKSAVLCTDAPAFIVNRLLTRFLGGSIEALRSGNSFQEIDDAIRRLGLPMGPFVLLGLVGLQVALHTAETLEEAFGERFAIDPAFRTIASSGRPGIYDWPAGGAVYDDIAAAVEVEEGATPLTADEIRAKAVEAVADEARRMLDDGVVADARDIDTAMLLGAGWPFFNGGICLYLDQTGVSERLFGRPFVTAEDHGRR
jgi:3-hydroxyacyl-CoA dehydrogenase/enoyl-CoA hydratase/carnithine racemase